MTTLRTRASKGSALTHNEVDANFKRTVAQKTTTYQILISDNRSIIEGNHDLTPFTITLPPVATADNSETGDFEVTITNINAAVVTVDGSGAETIDGSANVSLPQWASVTCQLDSAQTGWKIINIAGGDVTFGALTATTFDGIIGSVTPAAIDATTITSAGDITSGGNVISDTDSTDDLGSTGVRWANAFIDALTVTDTITLGSDAVNPLVLATEQPSTSGTEIDFPSIPSWVKQITIMFVGVSTSGTDDILIQLGDSGGIEATGYLGSSTALGSGAATANYTAGLGLNDSVGAAAVRHGHIILSLENAAAFTWVGSAFISLSDSAGTVISGASKSLSAALDRVRITTVGGSDTFDAGAINILYE